MRDTSEETLPELVSRVIDDAKEVARAEFELIKAQAAVRLAGYRTAAILFAVAGLLATIGLFGLVVGLILTIAQYTGAGWATLIVIGTTMVLSGLLGWLGLQRWKRG